MQLATAAARMRPPAKSGNICMKGKVVRMESVVQLKENNQNRLGIVRN